MTTNIVWLQSDHDESLPNELRPYVALFTGEDACFQFISSLPSTLRGLTLAVTDSTVSIDRLVQLKPISTIYLLSPTKSSVKTSSKIHGVFNDRQSLISPVHLDSLPASWHHFKASILFSRIHRHGHVLSYQH
jgi:hypothetical protein